jgi:hypothetical protein
MAVTNSDLEYAMHIVRVKKRYENAYTPLIRKAIEQQMQPVIDTLQRSGIEIAKLSIGLIQPATINKVLKSLYLNITPKEALREWRKLKRTKAGFGEPTQEWLDLIDRFYDVNILNNSVQEITDTTKKRLRLIFEQGITEGLGIDDIVKLIQEQGLQLIRARLIARTEINRAVNYGHNIAVKSIGFVVKKKWVAARDVRTRGAVGYDKADHYHMRGQLVAYDEPFTDPVSNAKMMFPGDTELGAQGKDVINCRCVVVHEPQRDADGNLIMN